MLELKHVTLTLRQNGRTLAEDLSFTLAAGEKAVLIGEEGNGKSTLLQYILDPARVAGYCESSGTVLARGPMGYLPQRLPAAEEERTLAEYFADTTPYAHSGLCRALDLPMSFFRSDQRLGTLSGGEKVKAQLARLLFAEPDILLLDEPGNDLDMETLLWLERFLKQTACTVLYISHDELLIERTAETVIHMEQLRKKSSCRITVSHSDYRSYVSSRRSAFAHQEQIASKQREEHRKQMERYQRIYERVDHEQSAVSRNDPHGGRLLKKKMHAVLSLGQRLERETADFLEFPDEEEAILTRFDPEVSIPMGKTILELELPRLTAGGKCLAEHVRLRVVGPAHIGITGKNGAGKSTLLSSIWEMLHTRRDITARYMPQNYAEAVDERISAVSFLAPDGDKDSVTRARTYLGSMRFTHGEMTGPISALSGGQKAKVLFLRMVLDQADVLLLDEPTRNFSPLSAPVIRRTLADFGGCILSVSHDRKYLAEVCDTVYELTPEGLREWNIDAATEP